MPTHPNESIPEPWLSFLRELDSVAREEVRLDCMGGFVVTMVLDFHGPGHGRLNYHMCFGEISETRREKEVDRATQVAWPADGPERIHGSAD